MSSTDFNSCSGDVVTVHEFLCLDHTQTELPSGSLGEGPREDQAWDRDEEGSGKAWQWLQILAMRAPEGFQV